MSVWMFLFGIVVTAIISGAVGMVLMGCLSVDRGDKDEEEK